MTAAAQLQGRRFGRLTIIGRAENTKYGKARWVASCDCGARVVVPTNSLHSGRTKSCGCLQREISAQTLRRILSRHGMSGTPTWSTWHSMVGRCTTPSHAAFKAYGAVGVTVCERWLDFEAFLADMGERPRGMTLDRIDNTKGYEPTNCRWATPGEQTRNRTITHFIEYAGRRLCLTDWAAEIGITPHALRHRLAKGWPMQRAMTESRNNTGPKGKKLIHETTTAEDLEFAIPHSPMVDLARNAVLPPQHLIAREREGGWGADGRAQMVCSCGWRGPWRHEWSDTMCTDLISDERAHRGVL